MVGKGGGVGLRTGARGLEFRLVRVGRGQFAQNARKNIGGAEKVGRGIGGGVSGSDDNRMGEMGWPVRVL